MIMSIFRITLCAASMSCVSESIHVEAGGYGGSDGAGGYDSSGGAGGDAVPVVKGCRRMDPDLFPLASMTCAREWPGTIAASCAGSQPPLAQCARVHHDLPRLDYFCCCEASRERGCSME